MHVFIILHREKVSTHMPFQNFVLHGRNVNSYSLFLKIHLIGCVAAFYAVVDVLSFTHVHNASLCVCFSVRSPVYLYVI